jgi:hypothetical protein
MSPKLGLNPGYSREACAWRAPYPRAPHLLGVFNSNSASREDDLFFIIVFTCGSSSLAAGNHGAGGVNRVVEHLSSKREALSSNLSYGKKTHDICNLSAYC